MKGFSGFAKNLVIMLSTFCGNKSWNLSKDRERGREKKGKGGRGKEVERDTERERMCYSKVLILQV